MNLHYGTAWAGTEADLHRLVAMQDKIEARLLSYDDEDEDDDTDDWDKVRLDVRDGTAIIPIKGAMLNANIPDEIAEFFGITTYAGLQRQFLAAQMDTRVKNVLLDVNSGGGAVSGLYETQQALLRLKAEKPVMTFAGDTMASAAYWLGSTANKIVATPVSVIGSIGVIAVHVSEKQAMENEGYKPTVMRAGEKKHLGHTLEDFSLEAQADMQKHLDFVHGRFIDAVAENRGLSAAVLRNGIADGRVFYGQEAVDVGLVDRIGSDFASFWAEWQATVGSDVHQGGLTANVGNPLFVYEESAMNVEELQAQLAALQGDLTARETALAEAQASVAKAQSDLAAATATNEALAASLATANEANAQFAQVLQDNINAKANALGMRVLMPSALADLQAMSAQLEAEFQAKFPAGGVAASAAANEVEGEAEASLPAWLKNVQR